MKTRFVTSFRKQNKCLEYLTMIDTGEVNHSGGHEIRALVEVQDDVGEQYTVIFGFYVANIGSISEFDGIYIAHAVRGSVKMVDRHYKPADCYRGKRLELCQTWLLGSIGADPRALAAELVGQLQSEQELAAAKG